MRSRHTFVALVLIGLCALGAREAFSQTCDQTLSVGADVAAAVSSAPSGSTVCLNSGDYGTVNLSNINKSDFVTLAAAPGATVTISPLLDGVSYIRIQGVTIGNSHVLGNFHHVEYVDSTFQPGQDGLYFNTGSDTPPSTDQAIRVDGCVFTDVSTALWDGRLNFRGVRGAKVTNTVFSGSQNSGTKSDGIMLIGGSREVEIGPGNEFHSFLQSAANEGEHVDSIQIYGAGPDNKIIGNYFHDSDVFAGAFDGVNALTIEHNVFDGASSESVFKVTMQAASNIVFRHNTLRNARFRIDNKSGDPVSSNVLAENNVFLAESEIAQTGGCNNCTYQSNVFDSSSPATGTGNIIGTPTFKGGASPTSYNGWKLATGSLGEDAGNDGLDMGIVPDGEPPPPPPPPTSVTRGETALEFTHDGANTDRYELRWGTDFSLSMTLSPVRQGTSDDWRFTLAGDVPLGEQTFEIVAVGPGGEAAGEPETFMVEDPEPPPPPAPTEPSGIRVVSP